MFRKNHVTAVAPAVAMILTVSLTQRLRAQILVFDPANS